MTFTIVKRLPVEEYVPDAKIDTTPVSSPISMGVFINDMFNTLLLMKVKLMNVFALIAGTRTSELLYFP